MIILEEPFSLPEDTEVEVSPLNPVVVHSQDKERTLYERLESVIGKIDDLPEDFAENHDYYIHGTPQI